MRVPWKLIGLAGIAGVTASGAVVVRRRRSHQEYDPAALREKLHARLAETRPGAEGPGAPGPTVAPGPAEAATPLDGPVVPPGPADP